MNDIAQYWDSFTGKTVKTSETTTTKPNSGNTLAITIGIVLLVGIVGGIIYGLSTKKKKEN